MSVRRTIAQGPWAGVSLSPPDRLLNCFVQLIMTIIILFFFFIPGTVLGHEDKLCGVRVRNSIRVLRHDGGWTGLCLSSGSLLGTTAFLGLGGPTPEGAGQELTVSLLVPSLTEESK